jgi:hypothetical protein
LIGELHVARQLSEAIMVIGIGGGKQGPHRLFVGASYWGGIVAARSKHDQYGKKTPGHRSHSLNTPSIAPSTAVASGHMFAVCAAIIPRI